jgi:ABC-type sugar transport system ATPase subunit
VTAPRAVIEVEHLHKRYRDTVAVEDVSFTVTQGEIFGIIGPNGAGKTTTVETIEGLRTPDRGTVRVLGLDPWRDRAELRQRVGVQLQQSDLYDRVRVGEVLELFASFYRDPADPDRLLEELGLAGKLDERQRMARESLSEARRTVQAVGPEPLKQRALCDAMADVVERWSELHGVKAEVTTTGTVRPLHPEVEVALLRTAQEALANVAKHAAASRVGLTLSYLADLVTLDIRDDGGFGLTVMRQRVARLAGTLEIESEPGAGTAVFAGVPAIPREAAGG